MKRMLTLLIAAMLLMTAGAAVAYTEDAYGVQNTPQEIREYLLTSRWAGWEITGWVNPGTYEPDAAQAFVVVKNAESNDLLAFRRDYETNRFVYAWHNAAALPQVEEPIGLAMFGDGGGAPRFQFKYAEGDSFRLHCYCEQRENGTWNLQEIEMYNPPSLMFIDTREDGVIRFSDAGWGEAGENDGRVYGQYQRNLRYFSYNAFPMTIEEACEKLSNPPTIPGGTLSAKKIQFTSGQKYPVYHGPGEVYGQAANGKASVSTNDWIQVFGEENGWIMIQYDISSDQMRIGWIDADALPKRVDVHELVYEPITARTAGRVKMTDDPLTSQTVIGTLEADTEVLWLATMGEWAYIENALARGFVKANMLITSENE